MRWGTTIASLLLLGAAPQSQGVEVATYGTGLLPCSSYLHAREMQGSSSQIAFINWFAGYLSGANATSSRRNNMLGLSELATGLERLDGVCRARPEAHFANAAGIILMTSNSTPGAHSVDVTRYGSGFRPCTSYIGSRQPQGLDSDEFIDWLGGYLSGANAMSLKTNDVLGSSELTQAIFWLDDYCTTHPVTPFSLAVSAMVDASREIKIARH